MKKFLFTLAALLMAGSLSATEYFYLDNFEVKQAEVGTNITVPVKAHFDYAMNAATVFFTMPEGLVVRKIDKGADIENLTYTDDWGDEWPADQTVFVTNVNTCSFGFATANKGYYEVDGEWLPYGAVKFLPGEYEEMAILTIRVTDAFQGGEIVTLTNPACGNDERPDVEPCPKNQENYYTTIVTMEGVEPQLQDLTGEITIGDPNEDGLVAIDYNGNEAVTIVVTINGEAVELVDGCVQLTEGNNDIVVVVSAEGFNDLKKEVSIIWAPQPQEVTATPVISYDEETFTVTAVGNGEVIMYVDGVQVTNPYIFVQGDDDVTYTVTATAQEPGKLISEVATLDVTVPAKEVGPGPEDPHMAGYWLVMLDKNNEPVWYELKVGENGDYVTTVALEYGIFGRYDHDAGYRGDVPYYFMIEGVAYGAPDAEVETVLGTALSNELFPESNGYYTVPVGYNYAFGIAIGPDGDYYVYASQANYVGVNELMNGKAVAGVRYFNMAGQEMPEANGMTIVVTTYTDGTTSAAKVMK